MIRLFKWTSFLGMAALCMSLSNCAGGKDTGFALEKNAPFEVTKSYCQKWVAGTQQGGSGINVYLDIKNVEEQVVIKHLYFRNYTTELKNNRQQPDRFVAYYKDEPKGDIIMDGETLEEAKNTPPQGLFPFNLSSSEAVIGYLYKQEMKYVKISNIEEKPMIAYPSNNNNMDEN